MSSLQAIIDDIDDDANVDTAEILAFALELFFDDEDSDYDDDSGQNKRRKTTGRWGGSVKGKAPNKDRSFEQAHQRLVEHYFSGEDSLYDEKDFERRFGVPRDVFNTVFEKLKDLPDFRQKYDALKKPGISPLCRVVACWRIIINGTSADKIDEYLQISETTANYALKVFCKAVVRIFGDQYLNRCPTEEEKRRLTGLMAQRGFPGCFGSWDCKHFDWKNCPVRFAGQYQGKEGKKTIVLEAVCDADLYIWYFFFGQPGSLNDINIINKSSILGAILTNEFNTKIDEYKINNTLFDWMYFLADGIYPSWLIFYKTNQRPVSEEELKLNDKKQSARTLKDVLVY